ncbi:hypothetical protein Snoj_36660 [Streptomyces nojiriensis]|uniref:Uncharacterized protein n=1 Tax=Streptomyces nojiriensis TaxID=66374 RepID=A0ABQ3SNM6_9ACTN|nr:hypothetical protein [Streptomyces nojiriensis]GGS11968.1 hypothetical protein GCM10010205_47030 [Streptomyces nojiriensis]GHI69748.1 hypothetical protein Snoj_36660 [Streptomyces nojiriensis]
MAVDTGLGLPDRGFLDALGSVIGPADVRWIRLTHRAAPRHRPGPAQPVRLTRLAGVTAHRAAPLPLRG